MKGAMTASNPLLHGCLDGSTSGGPPVAVVKSTTFDRLQQPADGNARTAVTVKPHAVCSCQMPLTSLTHQMLTLS